MIDGELRSGRVISIAQVQVVTIGVSVVVCVGVDVDVRAGRIVGVLWHSARPVSYTHLTLPTILLV